MSLKDPAMEKVTEEAMDHAVTTQPRSAVSPKAFPMSTRMAVATRKPQAIGATTESPRNWLKSLLVPMDWIDEA